MATAKNKAPDETTSAAKGICFVISPIGARGSAIRDRADKVLRYVIAPAVERCSYEPLRSDKISEPGMITRQIITQVIEAPMVVADLTDHNPNVFYELAIRHAYRKPVVKIIRSGDPIPFDVGQSRTIFFDHTDLASADDCREELVKQILAAEKSAQDPDNPISEAMKLNAMQQSDDLGVRQLAEVIDLLQDVSRRLERVESVGTYLAPTFLESVQPMEGELRNYLRHQSIDTLEPTSRWLRAAPQGGIMMVTPGALTPWRGAEQKRRASESADAIVADESDTSTK